MMSLISTFVLRICLKTENRRRDRLSQKQYDIEANVKDPCDWVSSFVILLLIYHSSFVAP